MAKAKEIKWLPDVEEHNYPAAESYLTILCREDQVAKMMARFRSAPIVQFKAKDVFRASQLSLLGVSNSQLRRIGKRFGTGRLSFPSFWSETNRTARW